MVNFPIKNPFTIKKKIGTIRKREIEYTVVPYDTVSPRSTLNRLSKQLAGKIGVYEGRIDEITHHTHQEWG
ncbi:hypothetical protein [Thermococcus sp.]